MQGAARLDSADSPRVGSGPGSVVAGFVSGTLEWLA